MTTRKVEKWAHAQNVTPPARKLVLVTLAHHSNSKGETNLSRKMLARACGISERMAMYHLAKLESDGFISRHPRSSQRGRLSNRTIINFVPPQGAVGCTLRKVQKTDVSAKCNGLRPLYKTLINVPFYTDEKTIPDRGTVLSFPKGGV